MSSIEKLKMIEHLTTDRAWDSFISKDKDFDVIVYYKLEPNAKSPDSKEFFSTEIFDDFIQWAVANLYDITVFDMNENCPNF